MQIDIKCVEQPDESRDVYWNVYLSALRNGQEYRR